MSKLSVFELRNLDRVQLTLSILITIPLGIIATLNELTNPSFPVPPDIETYVHLAGVLIISFQVALFIGLYKYEKWAWYLVLVYIGLHSLSTPFLFAYNVETLLLGVLISIFYFSTNVMYFKKRKPLFE